MATTTTPDFLLYAVLRLGGPANAARRIGSTAAEVTGWLRHGVARAHAGPIIRLARLANVRVSQFRLGVR